MFHAKYLGIHLDSKLYYKKHIAIEIACKKANSMLAFFFNIIVMFKSEATI